MEFVDTGHDLILAADESSSDLIREIASECGVEFDEVTSCIPSQVNISVSLLKVWLMYLLRFLFFAL